MSYTPDYTRIPAPAGFEMRYPEDPGPVPEYMGSDLFLGVSYDVTWNQRDGVQVIAGGDVHVQSSDILAACQDLLTLFGKVRAAEAEHAANVARAGAAR